MNLFGGPRYYNVFDYKPRHYDPEIEKLRDGVRSLRQAEGKDRVEIAEDGTIIRKPGSSIKGSFKSRMDRTSIKNAKNSTVRVLCIAAFLFFLAYVILVVDLTPIIEYFSK